LLAGALSAAAAVGQAQQAFEVKTPGVLRVLVQVDGLKELFALESPGGLEREMLQGFANLHGLKIELVLVPNTGDWVPWLLADKGDLIAGGLVATESRKKLVAFTADTFPIRHLAVNRKPRPPIQTLEVLRAERVAVLKGSSWAEEALAAGVPKANLDDSYLTSDKLFEALRNSTATAAVMSVIWAMVEKKADPDLQLGMMLGAPTGIGFAARKDQPRLLAALNEYVINTRKTATWSRLVVKYFGADALEVLKRSKE
jgi:membrane-bound lytic murein transglycosylase F